MRVSAITNPLQCPFRQNTVNKVDSWCFNYILYDWICKADKKYKKQMLGYLCFEGQTIQFAIVCEISINLQNSLFVVKTFP